MAKSLTLAELEARAVEIGERLVAQAQRANEIETQLRENAASLRAVELQVQRRERTWRHRARRFLARARRGITA